MLEEEPKQKDKCKLHSIKAQDIIQEETLVDMEERPSMLVRPMKVEVEDSLEQIVKVHRDSMVEAHQDDMVEAHQDSME